MRFPRLLALCIVSVGCLEREQPQRVAKPRKVSVCQIVAKPEAYVDMALMIDTSITSDGMHFVLLSGERCHRALSFTYGGSVPQAIQREISTAVFRPRAGTSGKHISGRFTGMLRKDPDERRFSPYYMEISSVENLKIEIPQPDAREDDKKSKLPAYKD